MFSASRRSGPFPRRLPKEPFSIDLLCNPVARGHLFDPLANVGVYCVKTTKQKRQQFFAKRFASGHPLVVVPPPMMVPAVRFKFRDHPNQPLEKLLVSHVHSKGHLGLQPVAAEMTFANENANQETLFEFGHDSQVYGMPCFTVKFPVKPLVCFTVKFHVERLRRSLQIALPLSRNQ